MTWIKRRHDELLNRVIVAARGRWQILSIDQRADDSSLRPDLVLRKGSSILILDTTFAFANEPDAFKVARARKEAKYQDVASFYGNEGLTDVRVEAIVMGPLGSWDKANDKIMLRKCSRKYLNLLR